MTSEIDDIREIRALIARQFASLNWKLGQAGDWEAFAADFAPDAPLYPAARPVSAQSSDAFVTRMKNLSTSQLQTFEERMLGADIRVFGNVAIAIAGCEIIENGTKTSRGAEAMLLIKNENRWQIAAQAWDVERGTQTLPPELAG